MHKRLKQKMYSKKAQLKIQEMAIILIAFFLLGGLGLIFFGRFMLGSMKKEATQVRFDKAISLVSSLAAMPEFDVASRGKEEYMLSVNKIIAFWSLLEDEDIERRYRKIFREKNRISKFELHVLYGNASPETCPSQPAELIQQFPACNNLTVFEFEPKNYVTVSTYLPLCKEITQPRYELQCVFARAVLWVELPE